MAEFKIPLHIGVIYFGAVERQNDKLVHCLRHARISKRRLFHLAASAAPFGCIENENIPLGDFSEEYGGIGVLLAKPGGRIVRPNEPVCLIGVESCHQDKDDCEEMFDPFHPSARFRERGETAGKEGPRHGHSGTEQEWEEDTGGLTAAHKIGGKDERGNENGRNASPAQECGCGTGGESLQETGFPVRFGGLGVARPQMSAKCGKVDSKKIEHPGGKQKKYESDGCLEQDRCVQASEGLSGEGGEETKGPVDDCDAKPKSGASRKADPA